MKKNVRTKLVLAVLLCGVGMMSANAQSSAPTGTTSGTVTSTTAASDDGATGTDPVPTKPGIISLLLIVLGTMM